MSLVPSSPSPLPEPQSAKVPFKNSIWRPVAAFGGALGVGLLTFPLLAQPTAPKAATPSSPLSGLPELVMQSENTLIVQPSMPPGALLRGEVRLVADVMGRAPVGGAVARHLVDPGSRVRRGQPVLEISSGQAERPAPAAEAIQNRAERAQIAATDAQAALGQKINLAQTRLRDAQERVERAQTKVGSARDLVRRLQNGETVALTEIPAPYRSSPGTTRRTRKRRVVREVQAPRPEARSARTTRKALRDNERALQAARLALAQAQESASEADDQMKKAVQNVAAVEARFDQKKASGADVEVARGAQKDAENAVNAADRAMIRAKLEVTNLENTAETLKKNAANASQPAPEPPATTTEEVVEEIESEAPSRHVTLDQAIRFAGAALDESRRASREAERIHAEIDDYQRQVTASKQRVESASRELGSAQQRVLDSVPRPRFTTAVAPADGVVTWVSRLAREVGRGQGVFGVARGDKVAVRFEDKQGLWRGLKPGVSLSAVVATPPAAPQAPTERQPRATLTSVVKPASPTIAVKVTEIDEPEGDGEAATVSADVMPATAANSAGANGAASALPALPAGTEILAAVARPGQKATLNVPLTAIVRRGETAYLAVLEPAPKATAEADSEATAEKENKDDQDSVFLLRWQPIKTGRSNGITQEVISGLTPGTRVVSLLNQLDEMGLTPAEADLAMANSASESVSPNTGSEDVEPQQIAVRLTTPSV